MDRIRIVGGNQLNGTIPISGAKNAALPLMIASLLTDDTLTLENVPHLADVEQLQRILGNHGVDISVVGRRERLANLLGAAVHRPQDRWNSLLPEDEEDHQEGENSPDGLRNHRIGSLRTMPIVGGEKKHRQKQRQCKTRPS